MSTNNHERYTISDISSDRLNLSSNSSIYTISKGDTPYVTNNTQIDTIASIDEYRQPSSVHLFGNRGEKSNPAFVDDERVTMLTSDLREQLDTSFATFFNLISTGVEDTGDEHVTVESFTEFMNAMQLDIDKDMIYKLFSTVKQTIKSFGGENSSVHFEEGKETTVPTVDTMTRHQAYVVFRLGMSSNWIEKILGRCDRIGLAAEAQVERQVIAHEMQERRICLEKIDQRRTQEKESLQNKLSEDKPRSDQLPLGEISSNGMPKSEEQVSLETVEGIQQKKLEELTKQAEKTKLEIHLTTEKLKAVKGVCRQREDNLYMNEYAVKDAEKRLQIHSQHFATIENEFNEVRKRYEEAKARQKIITDEHIAAKEAYEKVLAILEDSRRMEKSLEEILTSANNDINIRLEHDMTTTNKLLVEVRNALESYKKEKLYPMGKVAVLTATDEEMIECQKAMLNLEERDAQLGQLVDSYNEWLFGSNCHNDNISLNNNISYSYLHRVPEKEQEDHLILSQIELYLGRRDRK